MKNIADFLMRVIVSLVELAFAIFLFMFVTAVINRPQWLISVCMAINSHPWLLVSLCTVVNWRLQLLINTVFLSSSATWLYYLLYQAGLSYDSFNIGKIVFLPGMSRNIMSQKFSNLSISNMGGYIEQIAKHTSSFTHGACSFSCVLSIHLPNKKL